MDYDSDFLFFKNVFNPKEYLEWKLLLFISEMNVQCFLCQSKTYTEKTGFFVKLMFLSRIGTEPDAGGFPQSIHLNGRL